MLSTLTDTTARVPQAERGAQATEELLRSHIERRFIENGGLIAATRVITASLSLLTIPVVVAKLGVAGYGTWEALLALATTASIFQGAISGTLLWRVSEAFGRGDNGEIRRMARVGACLTLALFVTLWPMAWLLRHPAVQLLHVAADSRAVASAVFPLVAALMLLNGFSETLEMVVSGCQRTGLVNVVGATSLIVNYSVVIVMTALGGGLWGLVTGQAAGFGVRLIGAWVAALGAYGRVSLLPMLPRRSDLSAAHYSGLLAVGSIAAMLRDQTDKIILASLASPAWVGYYGIAARLSGLVTEVIRFFYLPMLTAVGALNATGDWEGVRRFYSRLMTAVSRITGFVVVVVAGLATELVVLWLGRPIPQVAPLLWLLITGSATAVILTGPGTALCRGAGRVGIETTYLACNLVLNAALTILLVLGFGARGTVIATGLTWAISSVLFVFVLHRKLDLPVDATRRAVGTGLVAAAAAVGVHWASCVLGPPQSRHEAFVSLGLLAPAGTAVYALMLVGLRLVSVTGGCKAVRAALRRAT